MAIAEESWRETLEAQAFQARISEHFVEMSDDHLARQAGTILEVDQMERGEVPNQSIAGDYRVQKICQSLLSSPLKPEDDRGFLESDKTRLGREACVNEFLRRLVERHAPTFGFAKVESASEPRRSNILG